MTAYLMIGGFLLPKKMIKFPFIPRLVGYSVALPDEVWHAKADHLPLRGRKAVNLYYSVQVSFILNGRDHDRLMAFYNAHRADFVEVVLVLDDSQPKPYTALFGGEVSITPLGTRHTPTPAEILTGTADTSGAYYETHLTLVVATPTDTKADKALVEHYERQKLSQKDYQTILQSLGVYE